MKTTVKAFALVMAAVLLAAACTAPNVPAPTTAPAQPVSGATKAPLQAWETKWNATLAAAKQEGKLVIYGDTSPEMRQEVSKAFEAKYGISIDWLAGRANELVARIISERRSGIFVPDVLSDATMSAMNLLKPTGALLPLEPALMLPDVTDTSKWLQNRLWFVDTERTHIAYLAISMPTIVINSDLVKTEEMASLNNTLDAKWKGRIVMDDPTQGGPGNTWVTAVGEFILNQDYLKKLAKQEPMILRNQRQEVEWIAQAKYPIGLGMSSDEIVNFIRAGAPVKVITPKEGTFLSQSRGGLSLVEQPPHPNAARVYLNWALSQEGQTVISKAEGLQSARIDVSADWVEPHARRIPDAKYFDTIKFEYQTKKQEYIAVAKDIFADVVPK